MAKNGEYISLREAAEISGYSSDYIGQLIRGGKLEGKQVYTNVSWMTTEEAVRTYMEEKGKRKDAENAAAFWDKFISIERLESFYALLSWFVIGILAFFLIGLGYVLAVAVDEKIERNYVETLSYGS